MMLLILLLRPMVMAGEQRHNLPKKNTGFGRAAGAAMM
jgi:hypothetical protein